MNLRAFFAFLGRSTPPRELILRTAPSSVNRRARFRAFSGSWDLGLHKKSDTLPYGYPSSVVSSSSIHHVSDSDNTPEYANQLLSEEVCDPTLQSCTPCICVRHVQSIPPHSTFLHVHYRHTCACNLYKIILYYEIVQIIPSHSTFLYTI